MKTGIDSLDTGAPNITYEGNQGPKSPQEDQQKMQEFQMAQLKEEYDKYVFDSEEQGIQPMSMEQFMQQIAAEAQMSSNEGGLGDMPMDMDEPTMKMPDPREMAAFGGIMGDDGRRAYVGGSFSSQGGYQGGGDGKGGKAGGAGTGTDNQGSTGGNDRDDSGDDVARPTYSEQYNDLPKADEQDVQESFRGGNQVPVIKGQVIPYAQEKIGETSYDVIPGNEENRLIRFRANNENAAARAANFQALQAAEKQRLIQLSQQGGKSNFDPIMQKIITDNVINNEDEDEDEAEAEFVNRFAGGATPFENYQGGREVDPMQFLASGGIAGLRQPAAFGGIMGDDGRRAYGLGSIFKKAKRAVSKGIKGIKKIAKSPLGKAALMYLGGTYLGGTSFFGGSGGTMLSRFKNPSLLKNLANPFMSGKGYGKEVGFKIPGFGNEKMSVIDKIKAKVSDGTLSVEAGTKAIEDETLAQILGKTTANTAGKMTGKDLAMILGPSVAGGLYTAMTEGNQQSLDEKMKLASRGPSINDTFGMDLTGIAKGARENTLDPNQFNFLGNANTRTFVADGGRIGYAKGGIGDLRAALTNQMFGYDDEEDGIMKLAFGGSAGMPPVTMMSDGRDVQSFGDDESRGMDQGPTMKSQMPIQKPMMDPRMMQQMMAQQGGQGRMMAAMGGRMGYAEGGESEELLDMGGMEKDYRNDGGFVPMGEYERKDDVPARLSKNEFVFTADAVRNAGGGDIDKGAEIMENMMKNLENGGQVSQGSQGLEGAREMFQTQQRLGEVL